MWNVLAYTNIIPVRKSKKERSKSNQKMRFNFSQKLKKLLSYACLHLRINLKKTDRKNKRNMTSILASMR